VDCTRLGSLLVTSLIRAPGKQHTSLETASGQQMGASIPLRRKSPTTVTHRLFLVVLVVTWGAARAAVLSSSISPDEMGLSYSVCRAVQQLCKGTSGFRRSLFLLLVLAFASFHSSALLATLPTVCAVRPCAVGPLQTALAISYLSPSQPP